jgi:hypothetical protein
VRVAADDWLFDGCPHAGPSLALDAQDRLHVAWWTGKPGGAGVYYARSSDAGTTFSAPVPLGVADQSRPAHVQLALQPHGAAAPTLVAAWDDGTRQIPQVVVRASADGGDSFGDAVAVSDAAQAAAFPVLGLLAGTEGARRCWCGAAWWRPVPRQGPVHPCPRSARCRWETARPRTRRWSCTASARVTACGWATVRSRW